MSEIATQRAVMLAVGGRPDCRVFRNTLGVAWHGVVESYDSERLVLRNARRVKYGVQNPGGADLLGWRTVNGVARFLAIEVKSEREQTTEAQDAFLHAVIRAGGIGIVARSVEDAIRGLEDAFPPV